MFIDDVKNRYTYLNSLKNIVHEDPVDRIIPEGREVILHNAMPAVLDRLLKERPTWRYKSDVHFFNNTTCHVRDLDIYDGDEKLGRLWIDHHWRDGTVRYCFDNFRLNKTRQRSGVSYTTKPDVAAKRIVKAFHLKTPKERAAEAYSDVRKAVAQVVNDASWPARRGRSIIEKALFEYAVRNWETIVPHLGPDADKVDLPALFEADREAYGLSVALDNAQGVTVRIESNGNYTLSRNVNNNTAPTYHVETLTDAQLPEHVRGALGLLKLVQDGAHIDGVGLRVRANLYFVTDKKDRPNAT